MEPRVEPRNESIVRIGLLQVNVDRSEAKFGRCVLALTWAQRCVLLVLLRHQGRIVDRSTVYEEAFGRVLGRNSRAVDIHVGRIRRELSTHQPGVVVTVGRVGYRIDTSVLHQQSRPEEAV